jgi:borealin
VQVRIKQIESDRQNLLKEVENLYNIEILRLPKALREMNWLDYFGKSCWSSPGPARTRHWL